MCRFCALVGSGTMAVVINLQTPVGESPTATAMAASSKDPMGAQNLEQGAATQQTSF